MFSPPSQCSDLQCPITSIGQLHVTMTSFYYNYKNPSVCCFLEQFRAVRDLQKFKKEKNEMSSNVVIVKMAHCTKQCVWSSVSNSSPACICHVFYFNFILKLRGAHLLHSFYLRFIFCILMMGRNRPSRTKKKNKKSENRTVPLRPQDYPSAIAVVRKWSRD